MIVNAKLWLQAACAAGNGETVAWSYTYRSQKQMHEVCTSKRRRLNNLPHRREHHLSLYNKLVV